VLKNENDRPLIVDAVLFNGELEILKLRMKYLQAHVDKFVVGQSEVTFSNKERKIIPIKQADPIFTEYGDRLDCVTLESVRDSDLWKTERSQRESLLRHIRRDYGTHHILFCDVDEIPSINQVLEVKELTRGVFSIPMKMTYIFVNGVVRRSEKAWSYAKAISSDALLNANLDLGRVREMNVTELNSTNWGCHLSYFLHGGEEIDRKFKSFSHNEYDFKAANNLKLMEIASKYAISPLGNFREKGYGLLKVEDQSKFNDVQLFAAGQFPNSIKKSSPAIQIIRMYYSHQITRYQKSKGELELEYRIHMKSFADFVFSLISLQLERFIYILRFSKIRIVRLLNRVLFRV
jgi:hypothetical protein